MTRLRDLVLDPDRNVRSEQEFAAFTARPEIAALQWPTEVLRQWLWEFGDRHELLVDYDAVSLDRVDWFLEEVPAAEFDAMPTGASEAGLIEGFAAQHRYWLTAKSRYKPSVKADWEERGTWSVPPVLIDRSLLDPPGDGLQVIEGRTRVAILRGRQQDRLTTANRHLAWVGRPIA
ncbi:hypothetical protein RM50_04315 [Pseudarthrobacter phenanthrenivorans]|uniref:Uncharacterized protein n=1 Tax=Pseudarthrobacter phenanthrenivorans TaxID=361575 RepID=A0A0B4D5Y9_PSEPS|nr:hypothetical protein RM50_04315 [Pseudarthrobacter phenanthrenivorans]